MKSRIEHPFETIESAHDFVLLLSDAAAEAKREIENDVQRESSFESSRRLDALRVALYSLEKLESHIKRSSRILNDLRTLRRLLFEERGALASRDNNNHAARAIEAASAVNTRVRRKAANL